MKSSKGKERKEIAVIRDEKRQYPSWNERIHGMDHKLTPKIKRFILLFVNKSEGKTMADFARHFKVNPSTINTWLSYPVVKKEIERLQESNEARFLSMLETKQNRIVENLLKLMEDRKTPAEVKRKIAYNLLSFGRIKDINTTGSLIQQAMVVSNYEGLTEEEIDRQIKEIEELDED